MVFDQIQASTGRKPRSLDHLPLTWRYAVRIAEDKELPVLAALVEWHIPGITNACEPALRVHLHHRGSVLAVVRNERIVGAAAVLYLNSAGLVQPYVILRPEGDWDQPGILEVSATGRSAIRGKMLYGSRSVRSQSI